MEKEDDNTASFCPSFSSYANDGLVETAERVRIECSREYNNNDDDDGFEFVNIRSDYEIGDCDLAFPVFNVSKTSDDESSRPPAGTTRLRDLFLRDREDSSSSSSSSDEEKELDGVSSEMYCRWTPEKSSNVGGWRKSKSTGSSSSSSSSRRWRIRDLLKRSYSEGKQSLSFLNSNSRNRVDEASSKKETEEKVSSSAHEKFYLKNKAKKEEEKRKSYLPYKQFGLFFFNVHHR